MTAPTVEVISYDARLVPVDQLTPPTSLGPTSWVISMPLGTPAGGTYTEVVVPLVEDEDGAPLPDEVQTAIGSIVTRLVAVSLYGTAWAFAYGPGHYAETIAAHELRRRERVVVVDLQGGYAAAGFASGADA